MGILKRNRKNRIQTGRKRVACYLSCITLFVLSVAVLAPCPAAGFELYATASRKIAPGFSIQPLDSSKGKGGSGSIKEQSGVKVTLKNIPEKAVLLHFWATWCKACVKELPSLEKMNKRYAKRGVRLLAVALESKKRVRAYLKEHAIDVPVYFDRYGAVMRAYNVNLLPITVVILKKGGEAKVAGRFIGAKEWGSPEGIAFMDKLSAAD